MIKVTINSAADMLYMRTGAVRIVKTPTKALLKSARKEEEHEEAA